MAFICRIFKKYTVLYLFLVFLWLVFVLKIGFHESVVKVSSPEYCSELLKKTVVVTFNQLLNNTWRESEFEFAFVLTDGIQFDNLTIEICPLIHLLKTHNSLIAASGKTLIPWKPVCTLDRHNWTVVMKYEYSRFQDRSRRVSDPLTGICYPCDLLPDVFVIKLKELLPLQDDFKTMLRLNNSVHLPFFLLLKGRTAYCPQIELEMVKFVVDVSCNNLSSRWDQSFAFVPSVSNIYRLIRPDSVEAWLGCVWTKSTYVLDLPIHCTNFIRQYLFDIVDILENEYKLDYRLLWGTVLGALRQKDLIPWSSDVDLYTVMSEGEFKLFRKYNWSKLHEYSHRRYSHLSKKYSDHFAPSRAFPMCPVVLSTRLHDVENVHNKTRNNLITKILENNKGKVSHDSDWRSFGHADIYGRNYLTKCVKKYLDGSPCFVEVRGRLFKTTRNASDSILCEYGKDALVRYPNKSFTEWDGYID